MSEVENLINAPTIDKPVNPLLARIQIPGATFRLPSNGIFYNDGELDSSVTDGEVHVYPLKAIDEIIIRSPDKILNGDAVVEVFSRCIPSVLKAKRLLQQDVDFLMVCLRKVSYGEMFDVEFTHTCDDAIKHTYSADMSSFINNAKQIDPTTVASKFSIAFENDQVAKLRPMRYENIINIIQASDEEVFDIEAQQNQMIESLLSIIDSIDDITDSTLIEEWLRNIPISIAKKLSSSIVEVSDWGPEFTFDAVCKDCGEEIKIDAPMNPITFFM